LQAWDEHDANKAKAKLKSDERDADAAKAASMNEQTGGGAPRSRSGTT